MWLISQHIHYDCREPGFMPNTQANESGLHTFTLCSCGPELRTLSSSLNIVLPMCMVMDLRILSTFWISKKHQIKVKLYNTRRLARLLSNTTPVNMHQTGTNGFFIFFSLIVYGIADDVFIQLLISRHTGLINMQGFAENDKKFKTGASKAFELISDMHGNWSCLQRNVLINSTSDTVQKTWTGFNSFFNVLYFPNFF